uniref:Coiled-coil domain containing 163 n=1 Tax=Molossus molossus TaxID=27622 RepID=A0A7J8F6B5_MOLMO|nr:coiled-coil domain containing 163 [Molossus molossus]
MLKQMTEGWQAQVTAGRVSGVLKRPIMRRGYLLEREKFGFTWDHNLEDVGAATERQEGKEATRTEVQDARWEHDLLRTFIHVLQSKLPLAITFTMFFSSSALKSVVRTVTVTGNF